MTRILVTGGTGGLGSLLIPKLSDAGYTVRVMSRQPKPTSLALGVEWARADMESGAGLPQAVADVDTVIHAASSFQRNTQQIDVDGTGRLLEQAQGAKVSHFIYVSIVGVDRIPTNYYRCKLAAEQRVEASAVPWSIQRITQFHSLLDLVLTTSSRFPIMALPIDFKFQPIDTGEAADHLVRCVGQAPGGRLPDIGGPEVCSGSEFVRIWLELHKMRRLVVPLPLFGKAPTGFRRGYNTCPQNKVGKITWSEWVQSRTSTMDAAKY